MRIFDDKDERRLIIVNVVGRYVLPGVFETIAWCIPMSINKTKNVMCTLTTIRKAKTHRLGE